MVNGSPQSYTFRDGKNQTAAMRMYFMDGHVDGVDGGSLATALAALTDAHLDGAIGPYTRAASAPVAGSSNDYGTIEDKAVLVFQTASGAIHRYSVPAPKSSIFLADDETVDFSNGAVATAVGLFIAAVGSRDGTPLTAAVGGTRTRSKNQRRFGIRTRNPTLTGQGL